MYPLLKKGKYMKKVIPKGTRTPKMLSVIALSVSLVAAAATIAQRLMLYKFVCYENEQLNKLIKEFEKASEKNEEENFVGEQIKREREQDKKIVGKDIGLQFTEEEIQEILKEKDIPDDSDVIDIPNDIDIVGDGDVEEDEIL